MKRVKVTHLFPIFHYGTMDVGNVVLKLRNDRLSGYNALMNIRNDDLGVRDIGANGGNDGVRACDIVADVGNDGMSVYDKFGLGAYS